MPSYGRGGAGNIRAVAHDKVRLTADVEANVKIDDASRAIINSNEASQEHMPSGRGGAGNFHSAAELTALQLPSETSDEKPLSPLSTRTAGRGGAGNYDFAANSSTEAAALEEAKADLSRRKIAQDVNQNVSEQLAIPAQARLANNRTAKRCV
jgi:hypothetical protein